MSKPARRGLDAAFGGIRTTLEEQRAIWLEALHEDRVVALVHLDRDVLEVERPADGLRPLKAVREQFGA